MSLGKPEFTSAGIKAVGPGRQSISISFSTHSLTKRKPGSEIAGDEDTGSGTGTNSETGAAATGLETGPEIARNEGSGTGTNSETGAGSSATGTDGGRADSLVSFWNVGGDGRGTLECM